MDNNCIFCQIANHQQPATIVYETDNIIAFDDLHKDAPIHVLIIPKKHIDGLTAINLTDQTVLGELLLSAQTVASKLNIADNGYRCIINSGHNGGQVIPHLHLHLLGGKKLGPMLQKDLPTDS